MRRRRRFREWLVWFALWYAFVCFIKVAHGLDRDTQWILWLRGAAVVSVWKLLEYGRDQRRRVRWRDGLCLTCGYDLRATPDRCPECGAAPLRPAPPSA